MSEPIAPTQSRAERQIAGKRVVILAPADEPALAGGMGLDGFVAQVRRRLSALGAEVEVIPIHRGPPGPPAGSGARARARHVIQGFRGVGHRVAAGRRALRRRRDTDLVLDVYLGQFSFVPVLFRRATVTVLVVLRPPRPDGEARPSSLRRGGRTVLRKLSTYAYGRRPVVVPTPSIRGVIRKSMVLRGRIHISPLGLETPSEADDAVVAEPSSRDDSPTIAWMIDTADRSWMVEFIDAAATLLHRHPELRIRLHPDGELASIEHRALRSLFDERVTVLVDEPGQSVGGAWLVVDLSVPNQWPLAVARAARAGRPAVVLDHPLFREAVAEGRTGWLVSEPANAAEIIERAVVELSVPATAQVWAQRCRTWGRTFDWDVTTRRLLLAWAAERSRRERPAGVAERRRRSDMCAVAEFSVDDPAEFSAFAETDLRVDDIWQVNGHRVWLLCAGCDDQDVIAIVKRAGGYDITASVGLTRQLFGPPVPVPSSEEAACS